jgi:hypothetical protein
MYEARDSQKQIGEVELDGVGRMVGGGLREVRRGGIKFLSLRHHFEHFRPRSAKKAKQEVPKDQ